MADLAELLLEKLPMLLLTFMLLVCGQFGFYLIWMFFFLICIIVAGLVEVDHLKQKKIVLVIVISV